MQWVKFHVSLLDNAAFNRLDSDAKLTLAIAIPLAAKQDQGGALSIGGFGPMTITEIAHYTGLTAKRQKVALEKLTQRCSDAPGFMSLRDDGAYVVERFEEKAGASSAERVRRFREKAKASPPTSETLDERTPHCFSGVSVTLPKREDNAPEIEVDQEKEQSESENIPARTDEKEREWVTVLRANVRQFLDVSIASLDGDGRATFGRYLAWKLQPRFDERANRRLGLHFGRQLTNMAADPQRSANDVRDLIGAAIAARAAGEDILSLWDIVAWLDNYVIGARRAS